MLFRSKLFLLAIGLTLAVVYSAAVPAPEQDIRITNGPVIEEATGNAAVIAWCVLAFGEESIAN